MLGVTLAAFLNVQAVNTTQWDISVVMHISLYCFTILYSFVLYYIFEVWNLSSKFFIINCSKGT